MGWSEVMVTSRPSWETAYRGSSGSRFVTANGLYFEVHRSAETHWYFIDRITADGAYLGEFTAVTGLDEVKSVVRAWVRRPNCPDAAFDGPRPETMRKRARKAGRTLGVAS